MTVDHEIQPAIRDAVEMDIPGIQRFLEPFIAAKLVVPRTDEDLATLVKHGFVAEHERQILGFAAIEIYSKKLAEVQALAVSFDFQRRGIGKRLVEHCVKRSREQGVLELMAITASDDLFRGAGFDYSLPNQKRALFLQTKDDA